MTDLLTPAEVAARLRVSRRKVYLMMEAGSLATVDVDGPRRVAASEVERFIAERTRPAAGRPPAPVLPIARRQSRVAELRRQQFGR